MLIHSNMSRSKLTLDDLKKMDDENPGLFYAYIKQRLIDEMNRRPLGLRGLDPDVTIKFVGLSPDDTKTESVVCNGDNEGELSVRSKNDLDDEFRRHNRPRLCFQDYQRADFNIPRSIHGNEQVCGRPILEDQSKAVVVSEHGPQMHS